MADSDHSMRYVCVTRRLALLVGAAVSGTFGFATQARASTSSAFRAAAPADYASSPDPCVSLWWEWATVHDRVQALSKLLQELEIELAERVDTIATTVEVPGAKPVYVYSTDHLDRLIGDRTDMADIRNRAVAELAARQTHFDRVSGEIGYFETMKAEQEAFSRAKIVLDGLATTPATSIAGVAGKLDAVARWGEAWDERPGTFPWPQIKSAHGDLVRLSRQAMPDAFIPEGEG